MSYLRNLKKIEEKPKEKSVIQKVEDFNKEYVKQNNQESNNVKQMLNKKTNDTKNDEMLETILNPSAKLNFIKFAYSYLTGKSTTNKKRQVMVNAVRKSLLKNQPTKN